MATKTTPYQHRSRPQRMRRRKTNREAVRFIDERGVAAVRVPLDDDGRRYALADARDYDRLRASGATGAWYANSNGERRQEYVRTTVEGIPGRKIGVARAILGAGPREVVHYGNLNTFDLRRWNLSTNKGAAKRDDRQLMVGAARNA